MAFDDNPSVCPVCGAPNPQKNVICQFCGSYISDAPQKPAAITTEAKEEIIPDWDTPSQEDIPVVVPVKTPAAKPEIKAFEKVSDLEPVSGSEKPAGYWEKMKTFRYFSPVWLVICSLIALFPPYNQSRDAAYAIVVLFFPGLLLYAVHKWTGFKLPPWILWVIELLFISLLFLLVTVGRAKDSTWAAVGMIIGVGTFVAGIHLKNENG